MIARRIWIYLAGLLALGIVAGAAWPPPPLPKAQTGTNTWSLPPAKSIARHVPQDMATLTNGMRWNADAGGMPGEKSAWRLAGTLDETGPAILVMTPDSPAKALRIAVGERLPDGSILQTVDGDRAVTERDNCITTYQLFHAEAVDSSDGCAGPDVTDQGTNK